MCHIKIVLSATVLPLYLRSKRLCRVIILTVEVHLIYPMLCSGLIIEFCSHAVDTLEDIIQEAIRQNFDTFGLTEHMPRDSLNDLYPEEV